MASKSGLVLLGDWNNLKKSLKPTTVTNRFKMSMIIAHEFVGKMFLKQIKDDIRKRRYIKNAPITLKLKGGRAAAPLIDSGKLFGALGFKADGFKRLRVGLTDRRNKRLIRLAELLQKGGTVRVSNAYRRFVAVKTGMILPGIIRIPSRPFLDRPLKRKGLHKKAVKAYARAMQMALDVRITKTKLKSELSKITK